MKTFLEIIHDVSTSWICHCHSHLKESTQFRDKLARNSHEIGLVQTHQASFQQKEKRAVSLSPSRGAQPVEKRVLTIAVNENVAEQGGLEVVHWLRSPGPSSMPCLQHSQRVLCDQPPDQCARIPIGPAHCGHFSLSRHDVRGIFADLSWDRCKVVPNPTESYQLLEGKEATEHPKKYFQRTPRASRTDY